MEACGLGRGFAAALLDSSLDAIVAVDGDGRVAEFNPAAEQTFGWSREQALGRDAVELLGLARPVEGLAPGARLRDVARHREGSEVLLDLVVARVDGPGPHAHILVMRDVTEGPVLFDEKLRPRATEGLRVEHELRDAIERDELVLHYQPQVSLLTGMTVGVEALVRWRHPTRGLLAPAEFIAHAEETGLVVPLGEVVLDKACEQARVWSELRPGEPGLTMSVNLAPSQLLSPTLLKAVERALEHSSLSPECLCLEITERTLMVDGPATAASIAALSGMGIRLAIDDFGTGYSSLSYLRLLPVDSLKVDAVFVEGLGRRRDDKAIVGAVIDMAHALGLEVVAEGVESGQQVTELLELDCDQAQGFRFARPAPAEDLSDVIERPRPLAGVQTAGA